MEFKIGQVWEKEGTEYTIIEVNGSEIGLEAVYCEPGNRTQIYVPCSEVLKFTQKYIGIEDITAKDMKANTKVLMQYENPRHNSILEKLEDIRDTLEEIGTDFGFMDSYGNTALEKALCEFNGESDILQSKLEAFMYGNGFPEMDSIARMKTSKQAM